MRTGDILHVLRSELSSELTERILPYWMEHAIDNRNGGFVGLVAADNVRRYDAPKSSILNARILWTFAAANRVLRDSAYQPFAERAAAYVSAHFIDPIHGGVYWMTDAHGAVVDDRKHVYAQAFAVYGLSEHFRATGDDRSLHQAVEIFKLIEQHGHDSTFGGYREAFSRDWALLEDVRLSEEDPDERKSMNTHLHVLEAYTNLFRVWPDSLLRQRLVEVTELFLDTIVGDEGGHMCCFFDEDWTRKSDVVSYGHDIEASWLLLEAADVIGDGALRGRARRAALGSAAAVHREGVDPRGGLFNEVGPSGVVDTDKEWWPQAEAIVGFLNGYEQTGDQEFLAAAQATWSFVKRYVLDREHGEWHRRVSAEGSVRAGHEKVGPWKGPYHNGRACLEVITRVDRLGAAATAAEEAAWRGG